MIHGTLTDLRWPVPVEVECEVDDDGNARGWLETVMGVPLRSHRLKLDDGRVFEINVAEGYTMPGKPPLVKKRIDWHGRLLASA